MENNSHNLVTLLTASLIHEVHIAKTLLANYNIESYIIDENIATSIGTAFVEGYKLQVDSADLKKAKKILDEINKENN
ncbi:putative signal transducing protein [Lutibacter sp.]|uniref:putative signal transducing protein n=1 Tax=Lutibacter sp. TaxID=1925666 RepID=UPI0035614EC7